HPVQRRVERPFLQLERIIGLPLYYAGYCIAMHPPASQRFEDQHIQSPLHQVNLRHQPPRSLTCVRESSGPIMDPRLNNVKGGGESGVWSLESRVSSLASESSLSSLSTLWNSGTFACCGCLPSLWVLLRSGRLRYT